MARKGPFGAYYLLKKNFQEKNEKLKFFKKFPAKIFKYYLMNE